MNELSNRLTEMLGGIIRVQFINAQGLEEAGVDGGGLFKDFLNDLISESFDPKFGLFVETPERTLYPNPASAIAAGPRHLEYFYFLGAILGKACYDGILLDVPLAGFFLASLKGRHIEVQRPHHSRSRIVSKLGVAETVPGRCVGFVFVFHSHRSKRRGGTRDSAHSARGHGGGDQLERSYDISIACPSTCFARRCTGRCRACERDSRS